MRVDQARVEEAVGQWCPAVRFLPSTDSTNRVAMEWAKDGAPERSLVVADHQTAGRGRMGRSWFSRPGSSLLFSLVLRPSVVVEDLTIINLAVASALCGALIEVGAEPRVKWPNDVLVGGRKVAGILAESEVALGRAVSVIVGVGVNVNIDEKEFPSEITKTATSVSSEIGREVDRLELLRIFLQSFSLIYEAIPGGRPERILDVYRPLCDTIGRKVRVEMNDRTIEATATGLDPTGGLILDNGEVVRAGEVVHLR